MARSIRDIMSKDVVCVGRNATLAEAARYMRDRNVGDVIIQEDGGRIFGLLTDRDIVVRALADQRFDAKCGDICTTDLITVSPDQPMEQAIQMMRDNAIRRLPVVENGKPVGFVSLGDLAMERDPQSVLGQVSSAPANNMNRDFATTR